MRWDKINSAFNCCAGSGDLINMSLCKNYKTSKNNDKEAGFTLIEISIVLVIIGLLAVGFVQMTKVYYIEKQVAKMDDTFDRVRAAFSDYTFDVFNYPCPASPTAVSGAANFGVEQRTGADCVGGNGVVAVAGTGGQMVYIGAVPTRTLGIASDNMLDPFKYRLTYAVSADVSQTNALFGGATPPGAITIMDNTIAFTTDQSPFALFSHGENGAGAYTTAGVRINTCSGSSGDQENCNDDAVFAIRGRSTANDANDYDDRFEFTLVDDKDDEWWMATDVTGSSIVNRNPVNVGIGTSTPTTKLDVAGAIRTGDTTTALDSDCIISILGASRYDDINDIMQYCAADNGFGIIGWKNYGGGGGVSNCTVKSASASYPVVMVTEYKTKDSPACLADEFLTGGGCNFDQANIANNFDLRQSRPEGNKWRCGGVHNVWALTITAYAICCK